MEHDQRLRGVYAAFNARDIDAVLDAMADDVDWPNAWEGGRIRGREAVRAYWTRQWAAIDPHVEPTAIGSEPDGRIAVRVHQIVRDLDGELLVDSYVRHVYTLKDGFVTRMDVEEPADGPGPG